MVKLTKRLRKQIEKKLELAGLSVDDLEARWDESLSVEENLKNLGLNFNIDYDPKYEKYIKKKLIEEEIKHYNELIKERLKNVKPNEKLAKFIKLLLKSNIKGLIVIGPHGVGKTSTTFKMLFDMNKKFGIIKGYTTPLRLYQILYENKNGIVVIDDLICLWKPEIVGLLLASTDTSSGYVSWFSSSKALERLGLPESFTFDGKIIILTNKLPNTIEAKGLLSRCFLCNLWTPKDVFKEIVKEMYKTKQFGKELIKATNKLGDVFKEISFRTLEKLRIAFEEQREIGFEVLKDMIDKEAFILVKLESECSDKNETVKRWCEITGKSRASYYRKRRKVYETLDKIVAEAIEEIKERYFISSGETE